MRILVIDDDDQMRVLLRQVMEWAGFEVTEAEDGREGMQQQRRQPAADQGSSAPPPPNRPSPWYYGYGDTAR